MRSLTLIPIYLWKNTVHRWIEHPASPLTKIFIPAIFSLLATFILILFTFLANKLEEELSKSSIRTITINEMVRSHNVHNHLLASTHESQMWKSQSEETQVVTLLRAFAMANLPNGVKAPIFTSHDNLEGVPDLLEGDRPNIYLLTKDDLNEPNVRCEINDITLYASVQRMPDWLQGEIRDNYILIAPINMIQPLLVEGYTYTVYATTKESRQVSSLEKAMSAYYKAEGRNVRILSSTELLNAIHELENAQRRIQTSIILFVACILSLILGNIAILEFNREAYLFALLRSFGVTSKQIILHVFLENIILVLLGVSLTASTWKLILQSAQNYIPTGMLSIAASDKLILSQNDIITLSSSMLIGAILAILPVIIGLRKHTGTILQ